MKEQSTNTLGKTTFTGKTYNNHPQWYNQPLRLTAEQKDTPSLVFTAFFECYHLSEIRQLLWDWMVEVLSSPHSISTDSHQRNNHIYFYEKIEEVVEAAWLIHQNGTGVMQVTKDNVAIENDEINVFEANNSVVYEQYSKPIRLIEKVLEDPLHVIQEVFKNEQLDFLKDNMANWLQVALSNDTVVYESGEQREALLNFYNQIRIYIEALYLVYKGDLHQSPDLSNTIFPDSIKRQITDQHKPVLLNQKQIENPLAVIVNFFKQFSITYIHRELRDWFYAGVSFTGSFPENLTCDEVFVTYESVSCLIEAGLQLKDQRK